MFKYDANDNESDKVNECDSEKMRLYRRQNDDDCRLPDFKR